MEFEEEEIALPIALQPHVATIGDDFEKHGGGLVLLTEHYRRHRAAISRRVVTSTRARIRKRVELDKAELVFLEGVEYLPASALRIQRVRNAVEELGSHYGDDWSAYAFHHYFSGKLPEAEVVPYLADKLDEAVASINRMTDALQG